MSDNRDFNEILEQSRKFNGFETPKFNLTKDWWPIVMLPAENVKCLFVQIYKSSVHSNFVGTIEQVRNFRKFDLENYYTHYLILPELP